MGNFVFNGEASVTPIQAGVGYVSPGHNSVLYDQEHQKQHLVFHTRFPNKGEMHQVRVHQLFLNEEDWPVVSAHRYSGETLRKVRNQEIAGDYQFIIHGSGNSSDVVESVSIQLNRNHTITGEFEGTWQKNGDYFAELVIYDLVYKGVFVEAWNEGMNQFVMTFTAVSDSGVSVWGSKL